ncbi:MAG TPA: DUF1552 domain-containing protein [Myxococcaceae bacterium]|nr:DUF1552 domain-containing protein [Myxococcaceae bacterium]
MSAPYRLRRRSLLQTLGVSALVAPFGVGRSAHAQTSGVKNFVVVTWPEGLEVPWQPTTGIFGLTLSEMLAPFEPFKGQMLFVNGLRGSTTNLILAHSEGTRGLWTGEKPKGFQNLATRPSIDQAVAQVIGADAREASLHFGAQTNVTSFISNPYVHYAGNNQPLPAEDDPNAMYKLVFGGLGQDPQALERIRRQKKSVLDFTLRRLSAVERNVSAADREKVQKHAEAVRSTEKGLDALGQSCGTPAGLSSFTKEAAMADANFPAVVKLQTDLLVYALQCGITRVATLQLSNTDSQTKIPGLTTSRGVHEAQHSGSYADRVEIGKFFVRQMAYLLERLRSVDMGAGKTLLDSTLVLMGTEMAIGTHALDPNPFFLAGGGAPSIQMGRYVNVARPFPQKQFSHVRLLTSVAQAMGVNVQTFGESNGEVEETGPLPGVLS